MFFWAHALIICHQCVVGLAGPISSDVMWMKLSFGYIFPPRYTNLMYRNLFYFLDAIVGVNWCVLF
jgi:hypothetical protein